MDDIREVHRCNETAQSCVPEALTCALEATDFEDALRNAVSLAGDAATLAAIPGGLAEALYGIPEEIGRVVMINNPGKWALIETLEHIIDA